MPGRMQRYVLRQVTLWTITLFVVIASMELLIEFVSISNDVGAGSTSRRPASAASL